jgi:lipid-A-disaccharide synthase
VRILISAGEASGDMYGAQLIEAMRACWGKADRSPTSTLEFFGAGGERMHAAGCDIVVDAKDLAVVGITEVVSHLPKILDLYKKLIAAADQQRPDAAVVIDSPAFNWRVARQMRRRGIPVVYYVCPQFWAWRQGRAKLLRDYVTKALVIFPFEEKFYRDRGVDATFVGHPLADLPIPEIPRMEFAAQYGLNADRMWIALLPGSRRKEFRFNLPPIIEAVKQLGKEFQFVLPVASTLDFQWAHDQVFHSHSRSKAISPFVALTREALPSLRHARAAVVASGTATVEAALMETPFVMVYRVSPLTYALGKPRIKVPHFAMVNLIAGEEVVPELVQRKFTAENIVAELRKIIPDGPARDAMVRGLKSVREKLSGPGGANGATGYASERAAKIILDMLK